MDTPDGKRWKLLRGQLQPGMWWAADPDPGQIIADEGGLLASPAALYRSPPNGFADARHIAGTPSPFATTWGRAPLKDRREGFIGAVSFLKVMIFRLKPRILSQQNGVIV